MYILLVYMMVQCRVWLNDEETLLVASFFTVLALARIRLNSFLIGRLGITYPAIVAKRGNAFLPLSAASPFAK